MQVYGGLKDQDRIFTNLYGEEVSQSALQSFFLDSRGDRRPPARSLPPASPDCSPCAGLALESCYETWRLVPHEGYHVARP